MVKAAAVKTVKYTEEQEKELRSLYESLEGDSPEIVKESLTRWATENGKGYRSVVAKLTSMGIYSKPGYVTKTGKAAIKKDHLVNAIAAVLGVAAELVDDLTKVNKATLERLLEALNSKSEG